MIKNRTAQMIFQTIYCTIGFIGCVASLGIFDDINMFRWDFYVHFTNISNFVCIGIMLAALIQTAKKKEDSFVTTAPLMKFIGILGILLTFLVFNIMLAGAEGRAPQLNWRIGSLSFHVVLPIMYVAHWFLFIYPYFFVNLETQGVGGVAKWVVILLAALVVVGFVFFGLDKIGKKKIEE